MKQSKSDVLLELGIVIYPIIFIIVASIWHLFGTNGIQPWSAIYFLNNYFMSIYLATLIYYVCGISLLRRIMLLMLIPYFLVKILYQVLVWCKSPWVQGEFFNYVWSLICVITFLIGAIITWKQLRRIG